MLAVYFLWMFHIGLKKVPSKYYGAFYQGWMLDFNKSLFLLSIKMVMLFIFTKVNCIDQ